MGEGDILLPLGMDPSFVPTKGEVLVKSSSKTYIDELASLTDTQYGNSSPICQSEQFQLKKISCPHCFLTERGFLLSIETGVDIKSTRQQDTIA